MANRYWVGGAGTWNTTSTTNWSTSPGGASGASVPTSADSVFFDQAGTYTVTLTGSLQCLDFTVSAGTVAFAQGTAPTLTIAGSYQVIAGTTWSYSSPANAIFFTSTSNTNVIVQNGTNFSVYNQLTFNGAGGRWTLGSAFRAQNTVSILNGTLDTSSSNYSFNDANLRLFVNGGTFSGGNSTIGLLSAYVAAGTFTCNTASISVSTSTSFVGGNVNLGSSTLTLGGATTVPLDITSATVNAASSTITYSQSTIFDVTLNGGNTSFNNFTVTLHPTKTVTLNGQNIFNNLTVNKNAFTNGRNIFILGANNTINSNLNFSSVGLHNRRTVIRSSVPGTQRVLTVNSFSANSSDVDFADISVTGTAAPISGARYGDLKNNSGITFSAPRTVYWNLAGTQNWEATGWANTSGGTPAANNFPLAQDTAIFDDVGATGTVTLGAWDVGTINMSARSNTVMTLSTTTPTIYGNWINGSNTTLSGTGAVTFSGRTTQTITSTGKTFPQALVVNTLGGTVQLSDALISTNSFTLTNGTFNTNNYNFTSATFLSNNSNVRTLTFGANSTFTLTGAYLWDSNTVTNFSTSSSNANNQLVICTNTGAIRATTNNLVNVKFRPTGNGNIDMTTTNSWSNLDLTGYTGTINRISAAFVTQPLTVYGDFDMGTVVMGDEGFGTGAPYQVNCIANRSNNVLNPRNKMATFWNISANNAATDEYSLAGTLRVYSPVGSTSAQQVYITINSKFRTNNNTILANQAQNLSNPTFNLWNAYITFGAQANVVFGSSTVTASGGSDISRVNYGYIEALSGAVLNMGTSNWYSNHRYIFNSGCTITAGTSTLNIGSPLARGDSSGPFAAAITNSGYTFNNVTGSLAYSISGTGSYNSVYFGPGVAGSINGASNITTLNIAGAQTTLSATCNITNLTLSGSGPSLTLNSNQNVVNLTSVGAVSAIGRYSIGSGGTIPRKLTANGTINVSDTTFSYIDAQGPSVPISGARLSVLGGTTNIVPSTPKTVYWTLPTSGSTDYTANAWALTPAGTADANNYPLIQDTSVISNSYLSSGSTLNLYSGTTISNLDLSARSSSLTVSLGGVHTIYGNTSFGSGVSFSGSSETIFSNDEVKTLTASGQTFPQNIRISPYVNPYWKSPNWANVVMYLTAATSGTYFGDFSSNASIVTTTGTVSSSGTDRYLLPAIFLQSNPRMLVAAKSDRSCSGDFTFEFSLYSTAVATAFATPMCLNRAPITGDFSTYAGSVNNAGRLTISFAGGPSAQTAASIHNSTWHHFAVVRSANNVTFYQNGVSFGSNTYSGVCDFGSTVAFLLGAWYNGISDNFWTGYVSEVALTKDVAKYTSNFTPTKIATNVGGVDFGSAITTAGTINHNAGQLSTNYSVTSSVFQSAAASYRKLLMGSGNWTLTGTGTVWSISGSNTALLLNSQSSNILINNNTTTARTFGGGNGFAYNKLTIGGANTATLTITGNNTFGTLSSIKTVAHTIVFPNANTTITNWAVSGSSGNLVTLSRTGASGRFSLVKTNNAAVKANYLSISNSTVYPTNKVWYAGKNSTNGGNTTNWIFTNAPSSGFAAFF